MGIVPSQRPRLLVTLPLEGEPEIRLLADSAEDEQRFLAWAWRSPVVRQLGLRLLAALDALDREEAVDDLP